jgi:hypothetical protein
MNPFAAHTGGPAVMFADDTRNGARFQPLQHSRGDGRLSSSSGEHDLSNGSSGRSGLSPSVSAMAAVTIRSNSGPPLSSAARQFGSGCFLVPGELLASGGRDAMHSLRFGIRHSWLQNPCPKWSKESWCLMLLSRLRHRLISSHAAFP